MLNNVLKIKETFFGHKKFNLSKSQKLEKCDFPLAVPEFCRKKPIFPLFVFGENKARNSVE